MRGLLEAVIEASPAAVIVLELDGTVRFWTGSAQRIFGWTAEEAVGHPYRGLRPTEYPDFLERLVRIGQGERNEALSGERVRKDGTLFPALVWAAPFVDPAGQVQCVLLVTDNSEPRAEAIRRETRAQFISGVAASISSSLDRGEMLAELAKLAAPAIADWCVIDLLEDGKVRRAAVGNQPGFDAALASDWWERFSQYDAGSEWFTQMGTTIEPTRSSGIVVLSDMHLARLRNPEMASTLTSLRLREVITAPIFIRDRFVGALTMMMSTSGRSFQEPDVHVCEDLASRLAVALENTQLYATERDARRRESKLHELTASLSKATTLAEVAQVTCRLGAEASEAPSGALWLVADDGSLRLKGDWGTSSVLLNAFRHIRDDGTSPAFLALETQSPVWVETEADYRRVAPAIAELAASAKRLEAYAAVCLKGGTKVLGLLALSYRGWRKFTADERALIVTLAEHCGQAFDRAILYEQLKRRAASDRFLASISPALGQADVDLPSILATATRLCAEAFEATCAIHMLAADKTHVEHPVVWDADPQICAELEDLATAVPQPLQNTLHGQAIRLRRPVRSDAGSHDETLTPACRAYADKTRVVSLVCVPLLTRDEAIGTLLVSRREPSLAFSSEETGTLAEAGLRIALVVDNARLFQTAKRSAERAEEASRTKDEFLATVSHELRTPLNAIVGWSALLREQDTGIERVRKGLEVIHRNAQAQTRIIEDILDVSRIVMGKLKLEPKPVDLHGVAAEALEVFRASATAKGIALSFAAKNRDILLEADPDRLQQVIWNLLSNAIKFTDRGGRVTMTVSQVGATVCLEVADTGRGIDPAFLPFVFDRFKQSDGSSTRRHGGLGLGLAIVRHIVELHGGDVVVASEGLGAGSAFRVALPAHVNAPPSVESGAKPNPQT